MAATLDRLNAEVEDDPTWLIRTPDGRTMRDAQVFVTEQQYRQMWNGYLCPWCFERLRSAFDRTCKNWCYGPRDATEEDWKAYMSERFGGEAHYGLSKQRQNERENELDRAGFTRRTGIWLP